MMTLVRLDHRLLFVGMSAVLAVAAIGFAGTANAKDNVSISVQLGVPGARGVLVGASNAYPVYTQAWPIYTQPQPVYTQPRPVYVQPAPVYYQPAPVYYYAPPVYVSPQPAYHHRPPGWTHGHHKKHNKHNKHDRDHDRSDNRFDGHQQPYYYNQGHAPVYYQR